RDEWLRTRQEETEAQKQKLQEELVEYKEQSKQHALTIVALEDSLLVAKQQQKTLEEENAALVAKMEGLQSEAHKLTSGSSLEVSPAVQPHCCLRRFQEELAVMQSMLQSKEDIIDRLTKELDETRARMSDLRGELSEEQKVEREQTLSQLKRQKQELKLLQEKLSQMSSLVEEKDQALKAAAEELRYKSSVDSQQLVALWQSQARCQVLADASPEPVEKLEGAPGTPVQAMLDLAELGVKCRGLRHEETIQRQKEGLAELRERVKVLEKRQCSAAMTKGLEPLVVLPKDLTVQKTHLEEEPALRRSVGSGGLSLFMQVPGYVSNWDLHGTTKGAANSGMAEVTDTSEMMYLDVIGALGILLEVKELSGMQPLQHLPQEERGNVGLRRQRALQLLYDKIRNLKSCLERKEEVLKDSEASMEQLRQNQTSLQRCQEEMSRLEDEASRKAEENVLLREALERTQLQLAQEKRLQRATKLHKV
ncbi:FHAD1 protein, partial [Rhinopomastus cyanomelas]|nr:FHAD1 protein [Rhinopomastus cyanomelas]